VVNFDDMCHSFGDITTSGSLAVILDFRHEVASTMIAGHLGVSYIIINPCIGFEATCVSAKTAKLLLLPVIIIIIIIIIIIFVSYQHVDRTQHITTVSRDFIKVSTILR